MPITWSTISSRLGLPRPAYGDTPVDLVDLFSQRDAIIDLLAHIDSGTLASRPVSTSGTPGKKRRLYLTEGEPDSPRLDLDYGTGWTTVGPDPASATYSEVITTLGAPHVPAGSVNTIVPYDTIVLDQNNLYDRIIRLYQCPSSGVYFFAASLLFLQPVTAAGQGVLAIQQNNTDIIASYAPLGVQGDLLRTLQVIGTAYCARNDVIRVMARNSSTQDLAIQGGHSQTRFQAARVA